jgi:hypothetical protein
MRLHDRVSLMSAEDLSEDSHGNVTPDWENAPTIISPAAVVPLSTSENLVGGNQVTTRWRLFLPAAVSVAARSRVLWRGDTYEVDGDVELHTDSRSRPHHLEALLVRVTG